MVICQDLWNAPVLRIEIHINFLVFCTIVKTERIKIKSRLPFLNIEADFIPNVTEKIAAWEIYVELATRITLINLKEDFGSLREVLTSMYNFFKVTREILKKHGPEVGKPKELKKKEISLGMIAIDILNQVLRPFMSKWHILLSEYEELKVQSISSIKYEKEWEMNKQFRSELKEIQRKLNDYSNLLLDILKIDNLHIIADST